MQIQITNPKLLTIKKLYVYITYVCIVMIAGVFETIPSLPKSFIESATSLYKRFRVIEDDPKLTVAEKLPHMKEWWVLNEKLFLGIKHDVNEIDTAVKGSGVILRSV